MKKYTSLLSFSILTLLTIPFIVSAAGRWDLIVCKGTIDDPCNVSDVILLFKRAIKALVEIATVITVLSLIYMGITLLTSAGKPQALSEVKSRAKWIIIGYVLILGAWVIVYTILKVIAKPEYTIVNP